MPSALASRKATAAQSDGRRHSGRAARTSISRPTNYYARAFGSMSAASVNEPQEPPVPPGFFPAIQFFTDSITALPKEVMRHMTLLKEVEAKLYGPSQTMTKLVEKIKAMPVPSTRARLPSRQDLLSFTANNSAAASANGSIKNGSQTSLQRAQTLSQAQTQASQVDVPSQEAELQADMPRRQELHYLRMVIQSILGTMDEKNVCLAEANRTIDRQLARVNSVLPHVEAEISEEARLGSLDHWAYADAKKAANTTVTENARRNVAATNSLAAAAATVHEGEIAAARGEAKRDKKRQAEEIEPKKLSSKTRKVEDAKAPNGQSSTSIKRRKVEGAPMERSASGTGKNISKVQAKSTPNGELKKKKAPAPLPGVVKKRNLQSPARSPAVASSPVGIPEESSSRRPSSARIVRRKSPSPQKNESKSKPPSNEGSVKSNTSRKNSTTAAKAAAAEETREAMHDERAHDTDDDGRHDRSRSRHILKQIASFNRSPVLGRVDLGEAGSVNSNTNNEDPSGSGEENRGRQPRPSRIPRSADEAPQPELESELAPEQPDLVPDEDGEEDYDANEETYCYCNKKSSGLMIGCDNEDCERAWFHLECTGLKAPPSDNATWYCNDCDPKRKRKA